MLKKILATIFSISMKGLRLVLRTILRMSMVGFTLGPHITRYYMNRHLAAYKQEPEKEARVLSISNSMNLCQAMGLDAADVIDAHYPEYNILSLPFPDNSFDYVVSDQVLEHVEGNPQTAIDETRRILKPNGLAIHATCFINPLHPAPSDFWRFTPDALRLLCRGFSTVVDSGGWGNPFVWLLVNIGLRYHGIPEAPWHPMNKLAMLNDPKWPITTWIIARK